MSGNNVSERPRIDQKAALQNQPEVDAGDLDAYRKFVAERAASADGHTFFNRSAAHAAIVIEYLFRGASREMNIMTGELHQPVYAAPAVISAAVEFLTKHPTAEIHIISEKLIDPSHPMLKGLADAGLSGRVSTKLLESTVAAKMPPVHFAVADGRSFRFEPDKRLMEAVIQFGEEGIGNRLDSFFKNLNQK